MRYRSQQKRLRMVQGHGANGWSPGRRSRSTEATTGANEESGYVTREHGEHARIENWNSGPCLSLCDSCLCEALSEISLIEVTTADTQYPNLSASTRLNPGRNHKLSEEPKLVKKNVNRSLQKLEKARRRGLTSEEASKGALKPERKERQACQIRGINYLERLGGTRGDGNELY